MYLHLQNREYTHRQCAHTIKIEYTYRVYMQKNIHKERVCTYIYKIESAYKESVHILYKQSIRCVYSKEYTQREYVPTFTKQRMHRTKVCTYYTYRSYAKEFAWRAFKKCAQIIHKVLNIKYTKYRHTFKSQSIFRESMQSLPCVIYTHSHRVLHTFTSNWSDLVILKHQVTN